MRWDVKWGQKKPQPSNNIKVKKFVYLDTNEKSQAYVVIVKSVSRNVKSWHDKLSKERCRKT